MVKSPDIMERPKFEHDNPERESMNNFHGHFPGGIFRPESNFGGPIWDKYGSSLDQDEALWPEDDRRFLLRLKSIRDIQQDLDSIFVENPDMHALWEENKHLIENGGGEFEIRDKVIRPAYIILRQKYSED